MPQLWNKLGLKEEEIDELIEYINESEDKLYSLIRSRIKDPKDLGREAFIVAIDGMKVQTLVF